MTRCPYCESEMRPSASVRYLGREGVKVADWASCTGCEHKTVTAIRTDARQLATMVAPFAPRYA